MGGDGSAFRLLKEAVAFLQAYKEMMTSDCRWAIVDGVRIERKEKGEKERKRG